MNDRADLEVLPFDLLQGWLQVCGVLSEQRSDEREGNN